MSLQPGLSEWEIAGKLSLAVFERGLVPFVTLVAVDERIFKYRHPTPTDRKLDKYGMVVLCARKGGLVANCTRLVHFGPLSEELRQKQAACQRIDVAFNLSSKPGTAVRDVFSRAQQEYAAAGYPDEWQLHHQGGGTGYESRDFLGTPTSTEVVQDWQAFAWNPSITGIKTEDTVLVSRQKGAEVLTRPTNSKWPVDEVTIEGLGTMQRPSILIK
jgi:antitoxin VapB